MAWERTSVMCVALGATLIRLEQIDGTTTFAAIGPIKMQNLQFYNSTASTDINAASALQLAVTIDNILINSYGDNYQAGYDTNSAIAAMTTVMTATDKTVENLSDAIVKAYIPGP